MNKINEFNVVYKLVIAGLSSTLSAVLFGYLMTKFKDPRVSIIFLLLVVVVVVLTINFFVEKVIDNSLAIRKIISGEDFIEGYWHDISVRNNDIEHSVLLRVQYIDGAYQVNGTTYTREGIHIATFRSRRAIYHSRVLFCEYESQTEYFGTSTENGIMKLHFDVPATSYTGIYFDYTGKLNFFIRGVRLAEQTIKKHGGFNNHESKREFILDAVEREPVRPNSDRKESLDS